MSTSPSGRTARGAGSPWCRLAASIGGLVLAAAPFGDPDALGAAFAQAQGAAAVVDVIADEVEIAFAAQLKFSLVASTREPVDSAILRFTVDDPEIVDRRIPVLETGTATEVIALHEEGVARGQIPPTAEITWWWSLHHADGRVTETERRTARYLDERIDWQSTGDDSIRVWFEGGPEAEDEGLEVASTAQAAVDWLVDVTGRRPAETIEIVTYAQQDDLRRALAARGEVYETRLRTLGARVAPSVVVLDVGGGGRDLAAVIFHELSHVVLGLHMDRPWADLPAWLDEGFAMYTEGELGGQEGEALDRALREDDLMSVRSLSSFPGDAERVAQAYGQSRDYVAFLIEEHDPGSFKELLDELSTGEVTIDAALEAVYGFDRLTMYQAYRTARGLPTAVVPVDGDGERAEHQGPEAGAQGAGADRGPEGDGPEGSASAAIALSAIKLAGGGLAGAGGLALAVIFALYLGSRARSEATVPVTATPPVRRPGGEHGVIGRDWDAHGDGDGDKYGAESESGDDDEGGDGDGDGDEDEGGRGDRGGRRDGDRAAGPHAQGELSDGTTSIEPESSPRG